MSAGAPLARVTSIKVKLGLLVAVSVAVAAVLGIVSGRGGVPPWLALPVSVLLALGVTQLLASGMTSPLRQMTRATARMARGDYAVRVVTSSTDEVGELAHAFNTMAADLAEVDRQRRELVGTVSHELRTPLAGLVAVLENLADGVVPADGDGVRTALAQAERLGALVSDLLDLSRVEAGAAPLVLDDVPLAALVAEGVAEAATLSRPVTYDVRLDPPDLTVRGDRARLHQLLANLLDNASRHSTPGGVVRVSAARHVTAWRLEVANPGDAVAPADRERAFARFGRLDGSPGGGTGLGLAVARWVTALHGGSIGFVDPLPGEDGARVRATFPLAPVVPTQEVAVSAPALPLPAEPVVADLTGGLWPQRAPRARPLLLAAAVLVGVLAAVLVADHDPGLGYVVVLLAGGATVYAAAPRPRSAFTTGCATLAAALASVLMWRDAEWVGVLCVLAATTLCVAGSARARSMLGILLAGALWPLSALHGLPWLGRSLRALAGAGDRSRTLALVRTAVVSLVALACFGLLFASADALFASWVDRLVPDAPDEVLVFRIFVGVAVGGLVLATAYFALNPPDVEAVVPRARRPVQHRYEWLVPVLVVDAVFVVFLAAQAAATFGGHAYLRRTTGLTYAEYVHQGFGQLTVATALTLLVAGVAARKAATSDRAWLRAGVGLLCVLTLVVVASALHRMDLYEQAYGFSRLRLLVDTFELWLGLLVLLTMAAGVTLRGGWLPRAALLSGAVMLLGLAVANPDARVARHNLERYAATGKVDAAYLRGLSADATPAILTVPRLAACAPTPHHGDVWEWNLGRARADDAYRHASPEGACPMTPPR